MPAPPHLFLFFQKRIEPFLRRLTSTATCPVASTTCPVAVPFLLFTFPYPNVSHPQVSLLLRVLELLPGAFNELDALLVAQAVEDELDAITPEIALTKLQHILNSSARPFLRREGKTKLGSISRSHAFSLQEQNTAEVPPQVLQVLVKSCAVGLLPEFPIFL